jgi:transposase
VSLLPSVRATWAPRGHTARAAAPVRVETALAGWRAGVRTRWQRRSSRVPAASWRLNGETLIEFLTDLRRLEQGRAVLLLWDGLPAHRSVCMMDWIDTQRSWLSVEPMPAYAPELNPTEYVWGNLKSTELANLCVDTIREVEDIAEDGLCRIGSDASLCFAFLRHTGLRL